MVNLPRISIITPTFNSERDIEACILSIANQTYTNLEHIFIDGASQDNTLSIIKKYAAKYPHIKYISEPDNGIYDAMNKGIDAATGEWIYFIGSDDQLIQNSIFEEVFSMPEILETDIIYGGVQYKYSGEQYNIPFDAVRIRLQNINHQAIFTRKQVFNTVGKFNTKYKVFADWEFNIRWMGNPNILSLYISKIIAVFNERGLSGTVADENFINDKYLLFEKHIPQSLNEFEPEVSVFIINDNRDQEIPRLIEHVLQQSFPFIELFIINKDKASDIYQALQWYSLRDVRLKIVNVAEERNWADGLNKAVSGAKGKWIWIITPEIHPDTCFLETILPPAGGSKGTGIVLSACRLYHHRAIVGKYPADLMGEDNNKWSHNFIISGNTAIKNTFIHYNPICNIGTVIINRDLYIRVGGVKLCNNNKNLYWDWLLYIKILLHARLVYIATELSFVVYPKKTLDKKLGKATKIMSLSEYTSFTKLILEILQANTSLTLLLLKIYRNQ